MINNTKFSSTVNWSNWFGTIFHAFHSYSIKLTFPDLFVIKMMCNVCKYYVTFFSSQIYVCKLYSLVIFSLSNLHKVLKRWITIKVLLKVRSPNFIIYDLEHSCYDSLRLQISWIKWETRAIINFLTYNKLFAAWFRINNKKTQNCIFMKTQPQSIFYWLRQF